MKQMANANKLMQNKKGLDYYVATITIMAIFLLGFVVFSLFTKDYHLRSGLALGSEQFRILKTYANAEKALLFVDDSARLALEQAAVSYGKNGFFSSNPPCGGINGHSYWAKDNILPENSCVPLPVNPSGCYPYEETMKASLIGLFTPPFSSFISGFNEKSDVKVPFSYEPFEVKQGSTEIIGRAKEPVTISMPNIKYGVKPSFTEKLGRDVVADGNSIAAVAQSLVGNTEKDIRSVVSSIDGMSGLDWDENFPPPKKSYTCDYPTGTCSCCRLEEVCSEYKPEPNEKGEFVCKKKKFVDVLIGTGVEYTGVPYDEFDVLMSVKVNDPVSPTGHKRFFVYDEATKKVVLKELDYNFALNWIEAHPEDAKRSCVCSSGYEC
ncbi:hypothetical protein HYU17_00565 [Candidatus Woesearchaeota archaeon]|nr:hypothetical protein [Candidatus Woesearchaeota archaeon]